jgi:magnesium-protoporphyrin O-methyltransferase
VLLPFIEALLSAALGHTEVWLALSYPRDVWYVRAGISLENAQRRLRKNSFRTFVHPARRMQDVIRSAGFELSTRQETWMWSVDVYMRRGLEPSDA